MCYAETTTVPETNKGIKMKNMKKKNLGALFLSGDPKKLHPIYIGKQLLACMYSRQSTPAIRPRTL